MREGWLTPPPLAWEGLDLVPSLLHGVELFTVTPTLIEKFERCQLWFLKNLFFIPELTSKHQLLKLSELNYVESEIALRKFLFLGGLLTETKMAPVVRKLFDTRAKSFFDTSIDSLGVLPSICDALKKYGLFVILTSGSLILLFPPTSHGKLLCIAKFENLKLVRAIRLLLTTLTYTLCKLALKTHHLASFGLFLNMHSSLIWSAVFMLRLD